jgi:hypothetical protein
MSPSTIATQTTIVIKILENHELSFPFPISFSSFTTNKRKILMNGKTKPFKAWANIITGIGLIPLIPKPKPITRTEIHTILKLEDLLLHSGLFSFPVNPLVVKAEARGAVIAEVKPAAKSPKPKRYNAQLPRFPLKASASVSKENSPFIAVPVIRTAIEIIPPSIIAIARPNLISDNFCLVDEIPDPRNKLYGTTVVPIKPRTSKPVPVPFSPLRLGIKLPFNTKEKSGLRIIAVIKNDRPINITIKPNILARNFCEGRLRAINALRQIITTNNFCVEAPNIREIPDTAPKILPVSYAADPKTIDPRIKIITGHL